MKSLAKIALILSVSILIGCFEPETFTESPVIELNSVKYVESEATDLDSIVLDFDFTDEEGDLGLNSNDVLKPYQIFDAILDSRDSLVTLSGQGYLAPYFAAPVASTVGEDGEIQYVYFPDESEFFSNEDLRPELYDCDNYQIIESDTFFVSRNEFYYNIHLTFEVQEGDGFVPIDFNDIFNSNDCNLGVFDGRFPVFDLGGRIGTIRYAIISRAFDLAFQNDLIRIRFYINDRDLNRSNEVVSVPFRLRDIAI